MSIAIIFIVNLILISLCLLVHYEMFSHLNNFLNILNIRHRAKVFWSMIIVVITHVIEVWIFAIAFYLTAAYENLGGFTGNLKHQLLDYVYYSFVTYTSLGLGDIIPTGSMRFLTGIESLVGLVLIAWSASFMYFQMQQFWQKN